MPGVRLKGGSSIHNSKRHERENGLTEKFVLEKPKDSLEAKRKGAEENLLPHWGHGKRSRCSRFEQSKHANEESSVQSKRVNRVHGGTDSVGGSSQANGLRKFPGQEMLRPGATGPRESVSGAVSRNGLMGAVRNSNAAASSSDGVRQSDRGDQGGAMAPISTAKFDHHHRLPACIRQEHRIEESSDKNRGRTAPPAASAAPLSSDVSPPSAAFAPPCPAQPSASQHRVDLDSFEWPRILLSLSRKEKEDDFLIFKGTKLPQRHKKRPKVVEKALQYCTPGNWLGDLTRNRYDVREKKSVKKKARGLKGMESTDSDTDSHFDL